MFSRNSVAWLGIILLSGMFLMGQDTWSPDTDTEKIVFITNGTYTGDLGGLWGADAICQQEAAALGLPGRYMAWLSDSWSGPDTRFVHSTVPYVGRNGLRVADDWMDLTDGSLYTPIGQFTPVWTNTTASGEPWNGLDPEESSCANWTAGAGGMARVGWSHMTDSGWTLNEEVAYGLFVECHGLTRLYCFQQ